MRKVEVMGYHPAKQMSRNEISAIMYALKDDSCMFEWGSGQSTIFFSQWCLQYYSVENIIGWFIKVERALVTDNVEYIYEPLEDGYIKAIHKFPAMKYDFILVDGDWRVRCAHEALHFLKKDGILFVHDWDRVSDGEYAPILDWYNLINVVDNLGVLKVK